MNIMACGSGLSSFLFSAVIWYCHPNYFVLSQGFVANLQVSMFTLALFFTVVILVVNPDLFVWFYIEISFFFKDLWVTNVMFSE
jgi:hypothetical protein